MFAARDCHAMVPFPAVTGDNNRNYVPPFRRDSLRRDQLTSPRADPPIEHVTAAKGAVLSGPLAHLVPLAAGWLPGQTSRSGNRKVR